MPYSTVADLPAPVKAKLKGKKLRQWMHVFNSTYDKHGDESRAFAEAWATVKKVSDFGKAEKSTKIEANYQDSPKGEEHCDDCTMFIEPSSCTAVKGVISPVGWCKFFKEMKKIGKANTMTDFQFFLPIAKVDKEKRTVSGYASTPTKDSDGEIVTLEAMRNALPDYMAYGNIREMHALKAVGVAEEANIDTKGVFLTAKIVDDGAWKKCLEGVYKGFSIGGKKLDKVGDKITEIEWTETSIVDRPANPDARFTLAKSEKVIGDAAGYLLKVKSKRSPEQKALAKMAKIVGDLTKAGPPAAHDGFSLPAKMAAEHPDGVVSVNDSRPNENVTRKTEDTHPEQAEVDKREFSEAKRNELASSGKALPDGSFPIENLQDLKNAIRAIGRAKNPKKAKAHIKARAKALGAEKELPEEWNKSKSAKKLAKKLAKAQLEKVLGLEADSFLTLKKRKELEAIEELAPAPEAVEKGMSAAGSLAYCFDSIRSAQRSLMMEAKREGGDMKDKALAKELGSIAKQLSSIISQKSEHEGSEATDFSDADDDYVRSTLGEDFQMDKTVNGGASATTGDPLTNAMALLMKRAAMPTKAQRMAEAKEQVKKARKAMKECRQAIEDVHKLHKASYLNKAAKKDKPADGDGEFDHAGAMEKLQKAYQAADNARTFGKAAIAQIQKAESIPGRSGQRGQEAGDGEAGFYEVPPGVKDLTPAAMSGAAPGTSGGGSQPPMYPADGGVYPGKATNVGDLRKYADRNGNVPANIAELIMEKAKSEGELEALRRLPAAGAGGRRPYAFDMSKVMGNGSASGQDMNKALFDGVNVAAIGSGDEQAHTQATAKVIGNFLTSGQFAKNILDPAFKGTAGSH